MAGGDWSSVFTGDDLHGIEDVYALRFIKNESQKSTLNPLPCANHGTSFISFRKIILRSMTDLLSDCSGKFLVWIAFFDDFRYEFIFFIP